MRPVGQPIVEQSAAEAAATVLRQPVLVSAPDLTPTLDAADASGAALPTHGVKPRDSLWKPAEDHLGDGFR